MSGNGDFNQNFYSFPDQQPNFFQASSSLFQRDPTGFSDHRSYLNLGGFASVYDGLQPGGYHLPEEILGFSDDATMENDTSFVADPAVVGGGGLYAPNSQMTSSSNDAAGKVIKEEDQQQEKDCGDVNDATKNVKMKKKVEKLPRFAFLTKSDNEQLEDGYRWRKYGQKNLKNSPHPRSYYRCTTRNCPVKKRVERMLENSSTVMTTYEGQHIHPYPVTPAHKGNSHLFSPPSSSSPSLNRQKLSAMQPQIYSQQNGEPNHGVSLPTNKTSTFASLQQKPPLPSLEFPFDFGFLEDDVPTSFGI